MTNFWQKIKNFFKNVFVRSEWTISSVLYLLLIILLIILLSPLIIVFGLIGLIVYLCYLPKILKMKKELKNIQKEYEKQMNQDNPVDLDSKYDNDHAQEATVIDEEVKPKEN